MLPASLFLGTIISLSILKKNNEILALRVSGLSPYRLGIPYIVVGLLAFFALFALNEGIIPKTQAVAAKIWNTQVEKRHTHGGFVQERIWLKGKNSFYQIDMIDLKNNVLHGITVYLFSPNFELQKRIDAQKAIWNKKQKNWLLVQGIIQEVTAHQAIKITYFKKKYIKLDETPQDFQFLKTNYQELNIWKLRKYILQLKRQGYDTTPYQVDFWQHTSVPFTPLVLIILGIGLILTGKETKVTHCIALGMLVAFLFWISQALFLALGKSNYLNPLLATWLPHLLFGGWGAIMLKYSGE